MGASGAIPRERLEAGADRVLEVPVTIVAASGGYGKTTLLLAWLARLRATTRTAWLSLSSEDDGAAMLARGVVTAIRHTIPEIGGSVMALLSEREPDPIQLGTVLGNELFIWSAEQRESLVLILDDLHVVVDQADVAQFLGSLMKALPSSVHLVIGSRSVPNFAPLGKLRIGGQLFELTEDELRFRESEARLLVDDDYVARTIVARTDGWPIAVHFTASLVGQGNDVAGALPSAAHAIFAFLAQEVFALLGPEDQLRLALLSLPKTLTGELVDFLFEQNNGNATLEFFASRGHYLSHERDGGWSMHHLFREFLIAECRKSYSVQMAATRRRYARWLREHDDKLGALEQVVEAGDLVEIVEYVHEAVLTIRFTDGYKRLLLALGILSDQTKHEKPMLSRFEAIALQRAGRHHEADAQLARCYRDAMQNNDEATACVALLERGIGTGSFRFRSYSDHSKSEKYFREALTLSGRPALRSNPGYHKLASLALGTALALSGQVSDALEYLHEAERLELASETRAELVLVEVGTIYGRLGDWQRALRYAEQAEEFFRTDAPYHLGYALMLQSRARAMLHDDMPRALQCALDAIGFLRKNFQEDELGYANLILADILLRQPACDIAAIERACIEADRCFERDDMVGRCELELIRGRMNLLTDRYVGARACLDRARVSAQRFVDRRLLAQCDFFEGEIAVREGNTYDALLCFTAVRETSKVIGDLWFEHLAWSRSLALRLASKHVDPGEISTFLDSMSGSDALVRAICVGDIGQNLVQGLLRLGIDARRVERIFSGNLDVDRVRAIVVDSRVPSDGRVAGLHMLVNTAPNSARALLLTLQSDVDVQVAATARVLSEMLPLDSITPITVEVLDRVRVISTSQIIEESHFGRKKAVELLRFLALCGGRVSKQSVISALWPDSETPGDVALRVTLHALRRALQPESESSNAYVEYDGITLRLVPEHVSSIDADVALADVARGKHLAMRGDRDAAIDALESGLALLVRAPRENAVPPWMQAYVVRWRNAAREAQRTLAELHRLLGHPDAAMGALRGALEIDPLDADVVAAMLDVCVERRDMNRGRETFAHYKRSLEELLGEAPPPGILERYSRLLALSPRRNDKLLSEREIEVLAYVAQGQSSRQVASTLGLSEATINNHVGRILKKLNVESRTAAVAHALAYGLITSEK